MPNPFYTYTLDILFLNISGSSFLHSEMVSLISIYSEKFYLLLIICLQIVTFEFYYLTLKILLNITHLFKQS